MKYTLRHLDFTSDQNFTQGHGMKWDAIDIEVPDEDLIVEVQAISKPGTGFDALTPVVRVWLLRETAKDRPPASAGNNREETPA